MKEWEWTEPFTRPDSTKPPALTIRALSSVYTNQQMKIEYDVHTTYSPSFVGL